MTTEEKSGQMWNAMRDRRYAVIELDPKHIVTMLNMARNPKQFLSVFTDRIPDDAFVVSVNTDWLKNKVLVVLVSTQFDVVPDGEQPPILLTEMKNVDLLEIAERIKRAQGISDGWNRYAEIRPQSPPGFARSILVETKGYVALAVVVGKEVRLRNIQPSADGFDPERDVFDYGNKIDLWMWIPETLKETVSDDHNERSETPHCGEAGDVRATQ